MPKPKKNIKKKKFGKPRQKNGKAVFNIEKLLTEIYKLNRKQVVRKLKTFKGSFKLDFSDAYLNSLSIDQLRHTLFAALLTKGNSKKK